MAKSGSATARKSPYVCYNLLGLLNSTTPPTNTHTNVSANEENSYTCNDAQPETPKGWILFKVGF